MCRGDDRSCPDFELHQQKLLDDLDAERRSFLKSAFLAGGGGSVGNIGIAAAERKAADDRRASGLEHNGLRKARSLAVAIEKTCDAHAFGMIATETGMESVDFLKTVDEPRLC